jgi:hypothetical protein
MEDLEVEAEALEDCHQCCGRRSSVTSGLDVSLNQRVKYRFACGTCSGVPSYKV